MSKTMNRRQAEKKWLEDIEHIFPGSPNTELYRKWFSTLTDAQFDAWIVKLERGETVAALFAPIQSEHQIDQYRQVEVAKEWGKPILERVWMPAKAGAPAHLTNHRYFVLRVPCRRQAQHLVKKRSIPEDTRTVDNLSGQPAGRSKGSKISFPEINALATHGLDHTALELIRWRGGDLKGMFAMNQSIYQTGRASQQALASQAGEVKSVQTVRTLLRGMMLKTTL